LPASEIYYTNTLIDESVSKKQYIEAFSGIIKQLSVEGNVVLHGSGINQFVPNRVPSISVFVSASPEQRAHSSAKANGVEIPDNTTVDEKTEYLKEKDQTVQAHNNMLGVDLMDMSQYDLIINLDRISVKTASQAIVNTILLSEKPIHEDATVRSVNRS
jgi:cytidylate kinase